jgi:hypothetical protein
MAGFLSVCNVLIFGHFFWYIPYKLLIYKVIIYVRLYRMQSGCFSTAQILG